MMKSQQSELCSGLTWVNMPWLYLIPLEKETKTNICLEAYCHHKQQAGFSTILLFHLFLQNTLIGDRPTIIFKSPPFLVVAFLVVLYHHALPSIIKFWAVISANCD